MSWSFSVANLDATRVDGVEDVKSEDGKVTVPGKPAETIGTRLAAHVAAEFEKNPRQPHMANAEAKQVALVVDLVTDAVVKMGGGKRAAVSMHGHANWDGKGPGQTVGFSVTLY